MKKFCLSVFCLSTIFACGTGNQNDRTVKDSKISLFSTSSYSVTNHSATKIPPNKDFELSGASAGGGRLSTLFMGHHMVIDLSNSRCSGCIAFAKNLQYEPETRKLFNGEHCTLVTIVDTQDLDGWISRIGDQSYAAEHSYGIREGIFAVNQAFELNMELLPSFLIIDRDGNVAASAEGSLPAETKELCSAP